VCALRAAGLFVVFCHRPRLPWVEGGLVSPTKRPSAVAGLRRGVATVPAAEVPAAAAPPAPKAAPVKPVRVTLNFPPDLFRDLDRWASVAADRTGLPRVGVQDAVRAMVRVITSGEAANAESRVLAELQRPHT